MTEQRTVVVHFHLFKNAGTSVEQSLEAFFGPRWLSFDKPDPAARIDSTELIEKLRSEPDVEAVSSHQLRPPLVDEAEFRFLPLVYLRHPIDRIRSAYEFESRTGPLSRSSAAAGSMSFAEWVEYHHARHDSFQCANFQTLALTSLRNSEGDRLTRIIPERHLDDVLATLEGWPAVGLVEHYDRSWEAISTHIRAEFPEFEAEKIWANAKADRSSTLSSRLLRVQEDLGVRRYHDLLERNWADLELHRRITERLEASFEADSPALATGP